MSECNQLLHEIEAFLLRNKMRPSVFGLLALRDTGFVTRLRNGKDVRMGTAGKVRAFMEKYKPVSAPSPVMRKHHSGFGGGRQRASAT